MHLPGILAAVPDLATKRFLMGVAAAHLEVLGGRYASFVLKQEATRRELISRAADDLEVIREKTGFGLAGWTWGLPEMGRGQHSGQGDSK